MPNSHQEKTKLEHSIDFKLRDPLDKLRQIADVNNSENINAILDHISLLEIVVKFFPGGICVFDKDLNLVLCNKQSRELLDYPDELFANGSLTLEQLFRFKAQRGEYGPGDIDDIVLNRMRLVRRKESHHYVRTRPNGMIVEVRGVPLDGGGFVTTYMDVTEVRQRSRDLETLLDNFPGGISVYDSDLQLVLFNEKLKDMMDYPESLFENGQITMEDIFRFNAHRGEYGDGHVEAIVATRMERARRCEAHQYDRARPDGTILEVRGVPLSKGGFVTTYMDVTEIRNRTTQLEAIVENFPGGLAVFDEKLDLAFHNHHYARLLEYPDELLNCDAVNLREIFKFNAQRGEYGPGDINELVDQKIELVAKRQAHEYERVRPDGTCLEVRGVPVEGSGFITTYQDITERRQNQAVMLHMAQHDALTDLPNRVLLRERLDQALAQAKRGYKMALLYLDLDKFKPVNDIHGHLIGDAVLKQVADRLRKVKRDTDTVARIGGDEFVVVQVGIHDRKGSQILAQRLIDVISEPFDINGIPIEIGTSVGIAFAPNDSLQGEELMKMADAALYNAKASPDKQFEFYDSIED